MRGGSYFVSGWYSRDGTEAVRDPLRDRTEAFRGPLWDWTEAVRAPLRDRCDECKADGRLGGRS